ncbi:MULTISPECIES: hypothetical protein [Bacillus subtilis group]|uniref:hypothetical protein n=1 Tax=Bacillus subtilis group TaxID=653685 RepID=UPI00227FD06F|nr:MULTISPECIES: hypothetical protein [Bacillus subtilis group]MCY7683276.1 hypothetical protein [Bacillus velezensis]MEC2268519.1 hypothetical protein [Bacillus subtilis]
MFTAKDINEILFSCTEKYNAEVLSQIENANSRGQLRKAAREAVSLIRKTEYTLQRMEVGEDLESHVSQAKLYLSTLRKGYECIAKGNAYKGAQYDRRAREIYAEYLRRFV